MGKIDGMYCYYDWIKPLKKVPEEDFKALFIAMLEYHLDGTPPPEFDGITGVAADFIFPQIARSKKYAEIGAKGGKATQANGSTNGLTNGLTNGSTHKHIHDTIDFKPNTDTKTDTSPPPPSPRGRASPSEASESFKRFWESYPKKQNKANALKAWDKLDPSPELADKIIEAVERAQRSEGWLKEGGKYIPLPTTYLNGRRWEDEVTESEFVPTKCPDFLANL